MDDKRIAELQETTEAALHRAGLLKAAREGMTTPQWAEALGVSAATFGKRRHLLIQAGAMEHCGFTFPLSDDGRPYRAPLYRWTGAQSVCHDKQGPIQ